MPLTPLPFPGVIYEVGTGENDSGTSMRGWPGVRTFASRMLHMRWLSAQLKSEFGYQSVQGADCPVTSVAPGM